MKTQISRSRHFYARSRNSPNSPRTQVITCDLVKSATTGKSSEKKGVEEGPSEATSVKGNEVTETSGTDRGKGVAETSQAEGQYIELSEEEDAPEFTHAYLYKEEERQVYLRRLNLCPEASDLIRVTFERTAQECSTLFTNANQKDP